MERLASNGRELGGDVLGVVVDENRRFAYRQFLSARILSEAAVVGNEVGEVLCSSLHSQHDRSVHERDVLRHVGQVSHAGVHREADVHHVALLPFTVDSHVG